MQTPTTRPSPDRHPIQGVAHPRGIAGPILAGLALAGLSVLACCAAPPPSPMGSVPLRLSTWRVVVWGGDAALDDTIQQDLARELIERHIADRVIPAAGAVDHILQVAVQDVERGGSTGGGTHRHQLAGPRSISASVSVMEGLDAAMRPQRSFEVVGTVAAPAAPGSSDAAAMLADRIGDVLASPAPGAGSQPRSTAS